MPLSSLDLFRGVLKFVAVVAVAVAAGVALGVLLSKLSGDGAKDTPVLATTTAAPAASPATTTTDTAAAPAPAPVAGDGTLDLGDGVTLAVGNAVFTTATTPGGKARKRGRLTVQVTLENGGTAAVTPDVKRLVLREGGGVVRPDPAADDVAGKLSQSLAAGDSVTGELQLETAGAATTAIAKAGQVKLRLGPKAITVKLG